ASVLRLQWVSLRAAHPPCRRRQDLCQESSYFRLHWAAEATWAVAAFAALLRGKLRKQHRLRSRLQRAATLAARWVGGDHEPCSGASGTSQYFCGERRNIRRYRSKSADRARSAARSVSWSGIAFHFHRPRSE